MNFLIDYNLRGQATLLWGTIAAEGWLELLPIRFVGFEEVGLLENSNDRLVWQIAQANQMIILTANRNMKGDDSLEQVIREDNTLTSFPVVTISNKERLDEQSYRGRCASRLVEIMFDLNNYLGVGRIYIP
jgi:predicted nuclease of predicted toxin-antitoxin system